MILERADSRRAGRRSGAEGSDENGSRVGTHQPVIQERDTQGDPASPAVFEDSASGKPVAVGVASFISFRRGGLRETVKDTNGICFVQGNSTLV
ncbi:hypothetical protein TNCV_3195041 [Trichonephila clavipes]|uniref:Uncharacterized protein n=1 Tax=Trichonephila clavipes TaxID=2585209 RepID=A0A8X6R938_TRICX|nr:hypothetical protein TNCV_3195041 [Trichonephila clavipes]